MQEELSLVQEENVCVPFPTVGNINKELYEKEESTQGDDLPIDYVGVMNVLKNNLAMQGWFTDLWVLEQDETTLRLYKQAWEGKSFFRVRLEQNTFFVEVLPEQRLLLSSLPEGYARMNDTGVLQKTLPFDPHLLGKVVDEFDMLLSLAKEIDASLLEKNNEEE